MLVDEHMAKDRVHALTGQRHGAFQVQLLRHRLLRTLVQHLHPLLGVIQSAVHLGIAFHRRTSSWHDGLGAQGTQSFQGRRPFGQLGVARVDPGLIFDQVTAEQHPFALHPSDGVALGVTRSRVPNLDPNATQIQAHTALTAGLAVAHHQGGPGQTGHFLGATEKPWETLHLAFHVLRPAFTDHLQGPVAGDDFRGPFGLEGAGAQHTNRVIVGQQHVLDGLVADGADAGDQVTGQRRGGGGVAHQNGVLADDHA